MIKHLYLMLVSLIVQMLPHLMFQLGHLDPVLMQGHVIFLLVGVGEASSHSLLKDFELIGKGVFDMRPLLNVRVLSKETNTLIR